MDLLEDIPLVEKRSTGGPRPLPARLKRPKTRVTSRKAILPGVDGRSMQARRFKDLIETIEADLGGRDALSEAERQLVRRAAALSAEAERQEALWALGEAEFDIAAYATLSNALRRMFETVGVERRAKPVGPTLASVAADIRRRKAGADAE